MLIYLHTHITFYLHSYFPTLPNITTHFSTFISFRSLTYSLRYLRHCINYYLLIYFLTYFLLTSLHLYFLISLLPYFLPSFHVYFLLTSPLSYSLHYFVTYLHSYFVTYILTPLHTNLLAFSHTYFRTESGQSSSLCSHRQSFSCWKIVEKFLTKYLYISCAPKKSLASVFPVKKTAILVASKFLKTAVRQPGICIWPKYLIIF